MKISSLSLLLILTLIASFSAQADWKGTLKVMGGAPERQKHEGSGQIFSSRSKIRIELQAQGQNMVILSDSKGGTASMIMPAQKIVMEMPSAMADQRMLTCSAEDVDGCLRKKGYRKTGTETVDGHVCAVYEGEEGVGGSKAKQKIWRPTGLKEVFMVKSLTTTQDGQQITTFVKDIKVGKLDPGLFKTPAGFRKMQMPDLGGAH